MQISTREKCPTCNNYLIFWTTGEIYECSRCGTCYDSELITKKALEDMAKNGRD